MRKTIFLMVVLLFNIHLSAQNISDFKSTNVKIYINGFYRYAEGNDFVYDIYDEPEISFKREKYDFGNISIAVELIRDKLFNHEFELMPIRIGHINDIKIVSYPSVNESWIFKGGKSTIVESAFRYQINHNFNKDKSFVPQIGLSSQLFYNYSKFNPATSVDFPLTEQNIGILFSCIPGILIKISSKVYFDFNIPLDIYNLRYYMTNFENPALYESESKKSKFISEFIPDYINIRIGLLYKLN
ncbi:MAG: hypothetical protein JXB00_01650 [Bacteroidales bacterium]|nr:hypothetical protein [Bacteroidales bacterium]